MERSQITVTIHFDHNAGGVKGAADRVAELLGPEFTVTNAYGLIHLDAPGNHGFHEVQS